MYSFTPIPNVPVDHTGFGFIVFGAIVLTVLALFSEDGATAVIVGFLGAFASLIAYNVSYNWTDQSPQKVYANVPVHANFVGYETEGYREKSGKSYVDRHLTYVIYEVNGSMVLLPSKVGLEYPKVAILYKN
jgi:hypothetical protein